MTYNVLSQCPSLGVVACVKNVKSSFFFQMMKLYLCKSFFSNDDNFMMKSHIGYAY